MSQNIYLPVSKWHYIPLFSIDPGQELRRQARFVHRQFRAGTAEILARPVALVRSVGVVCCTVECAFGQVTVNLGGTEACGGMGEEEAADDLTGVWEQVADLK